METITFGNVSSDSLGLILASKTIGVPELQKKTITIPGRDGVIDLSESLMGRPVYSNRQIKLKFLYLGTEESWPQEMSLVASAIHGRRMSVICSKDPDYVYKGRCEVDFSNFNRSATINITVDADPFKTDVTPVDLKFESPDISTDEELDVSADGKTLHVSGTDTFTINMQGKRLLRPTFTVSGSGATGLVFAVYSGDNILYSTPLYNGETSPESFLEFSKDTKVSISGSGNFAIKMERGVI